MERILTNVRAKPRREKLFGRDHLVVPATLIVGNSVLNGSRGPGYYPTEEIDRNPLAWNGMPLVLWHPQAEGGHATARDPQVLNEYGIGTFFSARSEGKLAGEAWFDEELVKNRDKQFAKRTGYKPVYPRIVKGQKIELSTGLRPDYDFSAGVTANGRSYEWIARNIEPDHVAILPDDQVGACSVKDGCGVNNAACECGECEACQADNAFCATGDGGGQDNSCGSKGGPKDKSADRKLFDRWLMGRTQALRKQGMSHKDALAQAVADWKKQEDTEKKFGDVANVDKSWEDKRQDLQSQLAKRFGKPTNTGIGSVQPWLIDIYDDYVVYSDNGQLYWLGFTDDGLSDEEPEAVRRVTSYEPVENAVPGQRKSQVTGRWKTIGAGTGKGEAHEAAQRGAIRIDAESLALGQLAKTQAEAGTNPASWVADEGTWEKAKSAADKGGYDADQYWAVVAHIYKRMGGEVKSADNSGGSDMDRKQVISFLVANCDCWKGKEKVLENKDTFSDADLQKLQEQVENGKKNELVANAARQGLTVELGAAGKQQFVFNEEKNAFVLNKGCGEKMEGEEEEDEEEFEPKKKAPPFAGNSRLTTEQFMAIAPPEIREQLKAANRVLVNEKRKIVGQLVANVSDPKRKNEVANRLMKKGIEELQDQLELMPKATTDNSDVDNAFRPASWIGAGGAPESLSVENSADDDQDVRDLMGVGADTDDWLAQRRDQIFNRRAG